MEEKRVGSSTLFLCGECGLAYLEKSCVEKCEAWCKKHSSCPIEIISHAVAD
ncbi:hypothetical protein HY572_03440 [Candidatus Micrarchaeota archaeon]|nr:hypothetical protein [Candidatus Micrarchaeota archaeon]